MNVTKITGMSKCLNVLMLLSHAEVCHSKASPLFRKTEIMEIMEKLCVLVTFSYSFVIHIVKLWHILTAPEGGWICFQNVKFMT